MTIESATGSIMATGSARVDQPDVVADSVALFAPLGEIGSGGRPLVLYVRNSVYFNGFRSLQPFWGFDIAPEIFQNDSAVQVDLLDLINLGGEQLVEVEELEEVNPAVFTAVTNYFFDDVSIRLPDDQLYDDELEELVNTQ